MWSSQHFWRVLLSITSHRKYICTLKIKLSNRYIYLFFSMMHTLRQPFARYFFFCKSCHLNFFPAFGFQNSVNYVQKDGGFSFFSVFLASVQTCVVNFVVDVAVFVCSIFRYVFFIYVCFIIFIRHSTLHKLVVVIIVQVRFFFEDTVMH